MSEAQRLLDRLIEAERREPPAPAMDATRTGWSRLQQAMRSGALLPTAVRPPWDLPPGAIESSAGTAASAGTTAAAGTAATAKVGTAGWLGSGWWVSGWVGKTIVGGVLAGTVATAGVVATRSDARRDAPVAAAPTRATTSVEAPASPPPAELPAAAMPTAPMPTAPMPTAPMVDPQPVVAPEGTATAVGTTPPRAVTPSRTAATAPRTDTGRSSVRTQNPAALDGEAAMLREANRALTAGDARAALAELRRHAQRYPDGVLAEDREALRVVATCRQGLADEAARLRTSFLQRWPSSVHAARVRAACGETASP